MAAEASSAPRAVRAAGALVALQGAVGAVLAVGLVVRGLVAAPSVTASLAAAGWFVVVAVGVLAVGIALWRGVHGARSPAVVTQLLLLGVAWYAAGPSARPEYGVPGALYCVVVLGLLFSPSAVRWAAGAERFSE